MTKKQVERKRSSKLVFRKNNGKDRGALSSRSRLAHSLSSSALMPSAPPSASPLQSLTFDTRTPCMQGEGGSSSHDRASAVDPKENELLFPSSPPSIIEQRKLTADAMLKAVERGRRSLALPDDPTIRMPPAAIKPRTKKRASTPSSSARFFSIERERERKSGVGRKRKRKKAERSSFSENFHRLYLPTRRAKLSISPPVVTFSQAAKVRKRKLA